MGRGWAKILFLLHLSNFFSLVTVLGSQGLLQSPFYEKLVDCCLLTRGCLDPSGHTAFFLSLLAGFTLASPGSWVLFLSP